MALNSVVQTVTERIASRSQPTRDRYLGRTRRAYGKKTERSHLGCANLAHAFAAMPEQEKQRLKEASRPNLAIVSPYNDMLSAINGANWPAISLRSCATKGRAPTVCPNCTS